MQHDNIVKAILTFKFELMDGMTAWLPEPVKGELKKIQLNLIKSVHEAAQAYLDKQNPGESNKNLKNVKID